MATITNPTNVLALMSAQGSQLVSHITLGDSNSERSLGWPHGIQWALLQYYGDTTMYGSGLFSFNERLIANRAYVGYSSTNTTYDIHGDHQRTYNVHPMPDALLAYWNPALDPSWGGSVNHLQPYWRTLADRTIPIGIVTGTYVYDETITQTSSGATGLFRYISGGVMYFTYTAGTFDGTNILTGGTSTATTTPSAATTTILASAYVYPEPGIVIKNSSNYVGWPASTRTIPIGIVTGTYVYGEIITQTSSGATGTFKGVSGGVMTFIYAAGTFDGTNVLTGATSGATCTPSATTTTVPSDNCAWRVWAGVFSNTDYSAAAPPAFGWVRSYIQATQQEFWSATALTSFKATDHSLSATQLRPDPYQFDMDDYTQAGGNMLLYEVSSSPKYPQALFWHEYINVDKITGFSLSQLYDGSGKDANDALDYLTAMGDTRIGHWLASVGHRANELTQAPKAVVWIMYGVNDATHDDTKATYKSGVEGIITRMKAAWASAGWTAGNLGFVVMPSQPLATDTTENALIVQYKAASAEIATADAQVMAVNLDGLTTTTELLSLGAMPAYDGVGDEDHLEENANDSDNSYSVLVLRVLQAMGVAAGGGFLSARRNLGMGMGMGMG